jgi:hypothetical protein
MNQAYVRSFEVAGSVSDGRIAAARVPPQESTVGQAHANEILQALRKVNMPGKRGNEFSSTQFVQHRVIRAFKKVGESLAVLAVANSPARHVGRADVAL